MANPAKDLTGHRFGYLTVIRRAGTSTGKLKKARWLCRCDCGNLVTRESQYLRTKHRPSPRHCGCQHGNKTHGKSRTPLHRIWAGMKQRCNNPKSKDYPNWGGRGITVCDRWSGSFEAFAEDMGPSYQPGLSLGRRDNNGPYSPENCRWETWEEQHNNRRDNTVLITPKGKLTLAQAAREYGLKRVTLHARLTRYGWDLERALTTSPTADPETVSLCEDKTEPPE